MTYFNHISIDYRGIKEADAAFVTSAYAFEEASMEGLRSWSSEWNQEAYIIGPLLPSGYGILEDGDRGSKETREFLDKSLVECGENSVIFVSTICKYDFIIQLTSNLGLRCLLVLYTGPHHRDMSKRL